MVKDLNIVDWILLSSLLGVFLAQVYFYARYMCAPARRIRKDKKAKSQEQSDESKTPGVSVVLAAHNESYNLSQYLQALLTQDWPEYEVIVVDDGSEDDTRAIVESYMVRDPRVHMTFVPYGARVLSTKKLAITLAAKAAKYDYLLLTDADCVPESNQWIREMMKGFEKADVILGFGAYFWEKGHINRLVRYDTLFNGLHYLGAALCGHPYMGVGRNLAYRKSLFFESGGFTHQMTNRAGDDDLFVNHVATKQNTAVVLSRESFTWSPAKKTLKEWWQQKRRHISVSPSYRQSTQVRLTLEPLTRGLFYVLVLVVLIRFGWSIKGIETILHPSIHDIIMVGTALLLFFVRWILQTSVLNTSARRMGQKQFSMFTVLWFDIVLPLVNLWMLVVPRRRFKW
ncbi:MAG: glycosyltransferase [Paludibacteraceae bacterium]|nr:glycosyltransferase [Paludibacteraceae bacterium]